MRFRGKVGLIGAAVAFAIACDKPPPPKPAERALEAELTGCAAIVKGTCEVGESRALRVWVPSLPAGIVAAFDDKEATSTSREVEGGTLVSLRVPAGAKQLRVSIASANEARVFRAALGEPPALPWLDRARSLRAKGEHAQAMDALAPGLASPSAAERALAKGLAARVELGRGNVSAAVPLFRDAIALDRESGRDSDSVDDALALAFALHQRSHRYDEARATLDGVKDKLASYADGRAREPYYRGILAAETGDRRAALDLLRASEASAKRLGLSRLERNAKSAYALELLQLGRAREATQALLALEKEIEHGEAATPCERAELKNNLGWAALVESDGGARHASAQAIDALQAAVALHGKGGCADPYTRSFSLGNLALAALQSGQLDLARAQLADARASIAEPRGVEVLFWNDLDGRIALAGKDPKRALAAFDTESRLAKAASLGEEEWSAAVGRAEALEAMGRVDDAARAYADAEAVLDRQSLVVPLGEGRGTFLGERLRSARQGVELLVRAHRDADAMAMARRSRARVLAGVQAGLRLERLGDAERARWEKAIGEYRRARAEIDAEAAGDWKLAADELARVVERRKARDADAKRALEEGLAVLARRSSAASELHAPAPGELVLALHPGRAGWIGLAADATGTTSAALGEISPRADANELGHKLLDPFAKRIASARKLRVVAFGELRAVDVHALPFEGAPLWTKIAVEYPLDVGAPHASTAGATALVVSDPTRDLPATRDEAKLVTDALGAGGWSVTSLEGERATSANVLGALVRTRAFHYAGHGVYAGREGWESALPLHGGGRLTIADVLALQSVPSRVVLSACESARTADDAPPEGLGLAQAFLAAGADVVIAPTRPVADALAAQVARALYGPLASTNPADAAEALRAAQETIAKGSPTADVAAFRVLRP